MTDTKLFLTIATTGLWDDADPEFRPEIVQLSLASAEGDELLTKCIVPTGTFQPEASKFNGYTTRKTNGKRKLFRNGKKVKTVPLEQAIHNLLEVIQAQREQAPSGGRILLMGYNSKEYDIPVLEKEMRECGLSTEPLNSMVICADLYLLIRSIVKSHQILPNHQGDLKMTTIFNELCGRQQRHMHNAVEDAQKLIAIYDKVKEFDIQPFTFQFKAFQGTKRKRDTCDSLDDQDRAQKFSSDVSDVDVRQSKRVKTSPW